MNRDYGYPSRAVLIHSAVPWWKRWAHVLARLFRKFAERLRSIGRDSAYRLENRDGFGYVVPRPAGRGAP